MPAHISQFKDEEKVKNLKESLPEFESFLKENLKKTKWLSGRDEPMMLDFHVHPFLERLVMLEHLPWKHGFDMLDLKETLPTGYDYVHRFREHEKYGEFTINLDHMTRLQEEYIFNGEKPPLSYDHVSEHEFVKENQY